MAGTKSVDISKLSHSYTKAKVHMDKVATIVAAFNAEYNKLIEGDAKSALKGGTGEACLDAILQAKQVVKSFEQSLESIAQFYNGKIGTAQNELQAGRGAVQTNADIIGNVAKTGFKLNS